MTTNELVFTKYVCLVKLFISTAKCAFLNLFGTMAYCLILKIGLLIQTKICALIIIFFLRDIIQRVFYYYQ